MIMEIKDVAANQGNIDLVAEVIEKEEPRTFEKFGKTGKVCNAKIKDETGELKLTLWNDDINKVNIGDKIHLKNGWCSEFQGEKRVSAGKFGVFEVIKPVSIKPVRVENLKMNENLKTDDAGNKPVDNTLVEEDKAVEEELIE